MNEFDRNMAGESLAALERTIRQAGSYVQPTDNLRPKTLEAARSAWCQRRTNWRAGAMIAAVLLLAIGQATNQFGWQVQQPIAAVSINREFAQRNQAYQRNVNPGWELYEAFCELRSKQAVLLKDSL